MDGSWVGIGVGLGARVGEGVGVGTKVQVAGRADMAVAWGRIPVADNCGWGAGVCVKPQAEIRTTTLVNTEKKIFFLIFSNQKMRDPLAYCRVEII